MALAISSYEELPTLADDPRLLNLAWTLDERAFLTVDPVEVMRHQLSEELRDDLPYLRQYFVQDPYGEQLLGPAVAAFFSSPGWPCRVICGAGTGSLLRALASLARGCAYVIGDVYPDFPHWVAYDGGRLVTSEAASDPGDHVANVRVSGASVLLVDRPALVGPQLTLEELHALCLGVASTDCTVIVDESHANYYAPAFSAVSVAARVDNLVVLRGLSKAYSLGGLRLGYAVSSERIAGRVRAAVPPMMASSLSLAIGRAVLTLGDIMGPLRARVQAIKGDVAIQLARAGLTPTDTSSDGVPYLFLGGEPRAALARLARLGICGKRQPFWMAARHDVEHLCRLSIPLAEDRRIRLVRALGAGSEHVRG